MNTSAIRATHLLALADQPVMLTEFGGIAYSKDRNRTWGYTWVDTEEDLEEAYRNLMEAVHSCNILAGFCYTQFTDTYQEANGLLYADRTSKFPLEMMREMTRGPQGAHKPMEWEWRERLMNLTHTQYLIPSDDYRTHNRV